LEALAQPGAASSEKATERTARATGTFSSLSAQANAAREANHLDEAVVLYKKALALRPKWAEGWFALGTIEYDRNHYAQAARAFRKLKLLDPTQGTALAMLGLCEFELGQDDLALKHIQASIDLGMAEDQQLRHVVLYHEGVLLQRKGSFESAQETLEQLCLQGVQSNEIANTLGMVLLRSPEKTAPAAGSPDAAVVGLAGRAECLAGQHKYDEARAIFAPLVERHPDYPNLHYAYGMFLLEARDTTTAIAQFKQEIKNTPDHVFARLQIAQANYKIDSAAGLPYAEEAVNLNPKLPFAHYLLGLLLLDTDNYQRAIPELELAKKFFPRESKLYFALGSAYARAGRDQDAKRARETFARLQQEEHQRGANDGGLTVH
jgi:tetratricopeptide (TPR) repeat protein